VAAGPRDIPSAPAADGVHRLSLKATWIKSASTTVATVLGQAPGFFVPLVVARILGATAATDAFFVAFALVTFVMTAVSGATQHALVPVLIYLERLRARALLAYVQTASLAVTAVMVAALALASVGISRGSAPFVAALLPFALAAALASVWTGALYAKRHYAMAAMAPAIRHVGVLVILWLFARSLNVYALAVGYSIAEIVRAVVLAAFERPPLPVWRADADARRDVVAFFRTGGAQAAGSAVIAMIPVVDRLMATTLPRGSVSLLDYADRVAQAPVSLLMSGFLVVSLAQWSHEAAQGDSVDRLRIKTRSSSLALCGASAVPIVMMIAFRHSITAMLFGRANLGVQEIRTLGDTLGGYLLGVPVLLAGLTYARAFLVLRRTDWLLKVSIGQFAGKILLNAALMPMLGLPGIALSTAVVYGAGSIAHVWRLHDLSHSVEETQ